MYFLPYAADDTPKALSELPASVFVSPNVQLLLLVPDAPLPVPNAKPVIL